MPTATHGVPDGYGKCRQCGAPAEWEDFYDEDGCGPYHEPGNYCERCNDIMVERAQKRREWDYYHPNEACPEIELPALPVANQK